MKDLVIVGYAPISHKLNILLGIDKLVGYTKVEYWDVSPIIGNQGFPGECTIPEVTVREIRNISEFKKVVDRLDSGTFVIFYMLLKNDTYQFYKYLAKTPCKIATVISGTLPHFITSETNLAFYKKIKHALIRIKRSFSFGHISLVVKDKLSLIYIRHLRPFDYYLYCGSLADFGSFNYSISSRKVPINSYDFLLAMKANKPEEVTGKYILFIDDYLPFHPDFLLLGYEHIDSTIYFRELNQYFDLLEKRYGFKVVIAAHPRADKYKEFDYFNGRQVFFNSTVGLSAHAEFVVTHYSTAISYAVISLKPLLFIYTDEIIKKIPASETIFAMAKSLKSSCVNITNSDDTSLQPVDETVYKEYLYSYETSPEVMDRENFEIILDIIK